MRPFAPEDSWNWNTAGLADNLYLVGVQARNAGSTATEATHETAFVLGIPPATGVALTSSPASPQPNGDFIVFDAVAAGPSGSFEYQFLLASPGSGPTLVRAYSSSDFWVWDTTGLADGTYTATVQARTTGSNAASEATASIPFTLASPSSPATGVTLSPSLASPQSPGTSVTWTAVASGGSGSYEYKIQLYSPTAGAWSTVKEYTVPGNTWARNTAGLDPGSYIVNVWARNAGSTALFEAPLSVYYVLQ